MRPYMIHMENPINIKLIDIEISKNIRATYEPAATSLPIQTSRPKIRPFITPLFGMLSNNRPYITPKKYPRLLKVRVKQEQSEQRASYLPDTSKRFGNSDVR